VAEGDKDEDLDAYPLEDKYAEERELYNSRIDRALRLAMVASTDIEKTVQALNSESPEEWEARLMRECGYQAGPLLEDEHPEPAEAYAIKLYAECDVDHSASLDRVEIRPLVQMLFDKRPEIARSYSHNIDRMVNDVMLQVDDDGDNSLDYVEFIFLLSAPPWRSLVPLALREDLDHLVSRKANERLAKDDEEGEVVVVVPAGEAGEC